MRALITGLGLCLLALGWSGPARAFGDCSDPAYLKGFGMPGVNEGTATTIDCVTAFEFSFPTPAGDRSVRAIHDISVGWLVGSGELAAIERGARQAAAAFGRLGRFETDDITILILEDLAVPLGSDEAATNRTLAAAIGGRAADGRLAGECYITIFAAQTRATAPATAGYVVAHEMFHCVEEASLGAAQVDTMGGGGAWWAEGAAELFAASAIDGVGDVFDRAGRFARETADDAPLYDLSYSMAVFWWWFGAERGLEGLMPALHQMAGSDDAAAQRAAMRAILAPDEWLRFAQAWADRQIPHPQGAALNYGDEPEEYLFDEDRTQSLPLDPFVLVLGRARYSCGEWSNRGAPNVVALSARPADGGRWVAYPAEVDAREGSGQGTYLFAGLNTGDGRVSGDIEAERRAGCGPCAGSDRIDACLVGTWVQSGGGAVEWMRAHGISITSANVQPGPVTYRGDGSYFTLPFGGELTMQFDDARGDGQGQSFGSAGRWSAEGGTLNICEEAGGMSGQVTMTDEHGSHTMPVSVPGGAELTMSYSCSETSLETSLSFPNAGPMVTQFSRADPPDEPEEAEEPAGDSAGRREGTDILPGGGCPAEDLDHATDDICDEIRRALAGP